MSGTQDTHSIATDDDDSGLDPREAANLLERTTREAQRELDFRSPWLSLLAAAAALVAFGSVSLSVRGQHPYKYPTGLGLLGLYSVVAIRIGSVLYAHHRAQAGVSGRSVQLARRSGRTGTSLACRWRSCSSPRGVRFAGPRGVWLSNGIGLRVVLLANSAIQAWLRRASR